MDAGSARRAARPLRDSLTSRDPAGPPSPVCVCLSLPHRQTHVSVFPVAITVRGSPGAGDVTGRRVVGSRLAVPGSGGRSAEGVRESGSQRGTRAGLREAPGLATLTPQRPPNRRGLDVGRSLRRGSGQALLAEIAFVRSAESRCLLGPWPMVPGTFPGTHRSLRNTRCLRLAAPVPTSKPQPPALSNPRKRSFSCSRPLCLSLFSW